MNEWLKKVLTSIKDLWSKWKPIQKVILIGIIIVVIIAIVLTARISAKPTQYRILLQRFRDYTTINFLAGPARRSHRPRKDNQMKGD